MKFLPALILIASTATLVACGARSSDEEQIRASIAGMETAAEARDASDVLAFVADDYEDAQGFDKSQLRNFLRGYFLAHPKLDVVVNISQLEFPADGLARAELSVTTVELNPDHAAFRVEFRRVDGDWRLTRADRLRP
jgi:hypothetical protein